MQIAIIDDNKEDRYESIAFLNSFLQKHVPRDYFPLIIREFPDAKTFFAKYNPGDYQLVFLDIFMPCQNGLDIAKRLRQHHDTCKIIFLTVTEDLAMEGYSVFASGYLIKPLAKHADALQKILTHILPDMKAGMKHLYVKQGRGLVPYPFARIAYMECYGSHFVTLHIPDDSNRLHRQDAEHSPAPLKLTTVKTQSTFTECFQHLEADPRFLECYHKVCVNMDYISSMDENCFTLEDGSSLPISRRRKTEVKQRYILFLSQK